MNSELYRNLRVGDIILIDSCNILSSRQHYAAKILLIVDDGYDLISLPPMKVRAVEGFFRRSRWVQWYQVDGLVKRREVAELERMYK